MTAAARDRRHPSVESSVARTPEPLVRTAEPLVSVGIPTYNRAVKLARAAESVLAQTHRHLELIVSDNASSDGTKAFCERLRERDLRVRYLRAPVNHGPTTNFNALFKELKGDYVMVLSDDDWLDPDYVATCLAELRRDPELALVCGRARYIRDGTTVRQGVDMQLLDVRPTRRVLTYLRKVDENGLFYGLMPHNALQRAGRMRNVIGNDWLFTSAVLAQGKARTLHETSINRELGGTSTDIGKLIATLNLGRWQARVPHLVIAFEVFNDIGWRSSAYRELSPTDRLRLALVASWRTIRWRHLIWHMTMPTFASLGRRRGGGWLWRSYLRFTRLLGARPVDAQR